MKPTKLDSKKITKLVFLFPGSLFAEEDSRDVKDRSRPKNIPKGAFAYYFYDIDVAEVEIAGKPQRVVSPATNESGRFYIGGEIYTLAQVKKLKGDYEALISNMETNDYPRVIKCRTGNWQPFYPDKDQVV